MVGMVYGRLARARVAAYREAITGATALGFLAGGLARLALVGVGDGTLLAWVIAVPFGAAVAAVLAGILVNLITLPALARVLPGRRLPDAAYRAAGMLCGLAAFAGAFADFALAGA